MSSIYGPFFEGTDGVWHWRKECPNFPTQPNPKMMVTTSFPEKVELCSECEEIDKKDSVGQIKKQKR